MVKALAHRFRHIRTHSQRIQGHTTTNLLILTLLLLLIGRPDLARAADENGNASPSQASEETQNAGESEDSASSEQTMQVITRAPEREEVLRQKAVPEHLTLFQRDNELITLVSAESSFYGLFLQERSGSPQGGVLILHDQGQHGHWPEYIAPLREELPDYGWVTLTIALPDPPKAPLPPTDLYGQQNSDDGENQEEATETGASNSAENTTDGSQNADTNQIQGTPAQTDSPPTPQAPSQPASQPAPQADQQQNPPAPDPDSSNSGITPAVPSNANRLEQQNTPDAATNQAPEDESSSPINQLNQDREIHRQQMIERINTAVTYLNTRGQYNLVVIASGISASWATQWLAAASRSDTEGNAEAGLALILINPKDSSAAAIPLADLMKTLALPILDIRIEPTDAEEREAKQRLGLMRHAQRAGYRQAVLNEPVTSAGPNRLVRQIRGWLRKNAAGTEIGR